MHVEAEGMTTSFAKDSWESLSPRVLLMVLRALLGIILIVTWFDNLNKGLYTPSGFMGFIDWLAMGEGHPLPFYRVFLLNVVLPNSAAFASIQRVAELVLGLALLVGAFTPLAGVASAFFFLNLFLAYLNPATEEWIWTYVLLMSVSLVVALGRAGRSFGVDALLLRARSEPKYPIY
jgi:uncharacterized membrane protein YphA (DoxX/SURF4 family)